jgi:hypothetical protein
LLLKLDNTSSTRATVGLVLDLGAFDLTDRREELDKILVAGRPWQVAHVDDVARLSSASSKICEGVRWVWTSISLETWTAAAGRTTETSTSSGVASASAKATLEAATAAETPSTTEAAAEGSATTESTSATEATTWRTSKAIFANLEVATLPLVAVELVDGISGIVHGLESYYAWALGATIRGHVDIGTENGSSMCSLTEEILQILPADVVG